MICDMRGGPKTRAVESGLCGTMAVAAETVPKNGRQGLDPNCKISVFGLIVFCLYNFYLIVDMKNMGVSIS